MSAPEPAMATPTHAGRTPRPRSTGSPLATCCTPTVYAIQVFDLDDLIMLIGADNAGRPIEIGLATVVLVEFIVHAMPARPMLLR